MMLLSSREDFSLLLPNALLAGPEPGPPVMRAQGLRSSGQLGSVLGFLCSGGVTLWGQCKGGGGKGTRQGTRLRGWEPGCDFCS